MDRSSEPVELTIEALVKDLFIELGLPRPPRTDEDLREAGLTSLQLVDLVFAVEDRCSISLPDDEINPQNFRSIQNIARMIERLRTATASA